MWSSYKSNIMPKTLFSFIQMTSMGLSTCCMSNENLISRDFPLSPIYIKSSLLNWKFYVLYSIWIYLFKNCLVCPFRVIVTNNNLQEDVQSVFKCFSVPTSNESIYSSILFLCRNLWNTHSLPCAVLSTKNKTEKRQRRFLFS